MDNLVDTQTVRHEVGAVVLVLLDAVVVDAEVDVAADAVVPVDGVGDHLVGVHLLFVEVVALEVADCADVGAPLEEGGVDDRSDTVGVLVEVGSTQRHIVGLDEAVGEACGEVVTDNLSFLTSSSNSTMSPSFKKRKPASFKELE